MFDKIKDMEEMFGKMDESGFGDFMAGFDVFRQKMDEARRHVAEQQAFIVSKRVEQMGITFNPEIESQKRFPCFKMESEMKGETSIDRFYYDDKSLDGCLIITFETKISASENGIEIEMKHY